MSCEGVRLKAGEREAGEKKKKLRAPTVSFYKKPRLDQRHTDI